MKRSSFAATMEAGWLPARAAFPDPAALLVLLRMGALSGCVDYGHIAQRPGWM